MQSPDNDIRTKDSEAGDSSLKRERIPIPTPRSAFLLVQCPNCGNEQVVFSSVTSDVKCSTCDSILAERSGGRAKILGPIIKRVD
ncbi:MAG: 30S ribosomal protein S27e [Nitrososphaerales archaeon]